MPEVVPTAFRNRLRFYCRVLSYFRGDGAVVVAWMALIGLGTGVGLLMPWPMAMLADNVLGQSAPADALHRLLLGVMPAGTVGKIVGLATLGLLLKLAGDGIGVLQAITCNHLNYSGLLRVRCDLFRKLQALSLAFHRKRPQGDTIYRVNTDAYGAQAILAVLVNAAVAAVTLAAMTVILAQRNVPLTLLAFSITPGLALANVYFGRRLKLCTTDCKQIDSRFTAEVQQSIACIGLVQAFGREDDEFDHVHGTIRSNIRAWWRLNRAQFAYQMLTALLFGLGSAAIFGYGGYLVSRHVLTIGDLFVFTAYLGMLWGPLCQMTGFTANLQNGAASMERVFEVLDSGQQITESPTAVPLPLQPRTLELHDVRFSYPDAAPLLGGLSLRVEPGQMVAFVGASGVGKTTLLNLLPRFYDPQSGSITLDGIDLRDIDLKDLRRHTALVLQEPVMLPTTIAGNIAYGRPEATLDEIAAAARLAGADKFITQFDRGYHTSVAEGGSNFSGGQRQRIAIARALLSDAPFMILDEPTSALDPTGERLITRTLDGLKGKRTIILVSHRLSTVVSADQVFFIDAGRVAEQGTHEELLALNGLYAAMAAEQINDPAPVRIAA